jgi:hypothetical protein
MIVEQIDAAWHILFSGAASELDGGVPGTRDRERRRIRIAPGLNVDPSSFDVVVKG